MAISIIFPGDNTFTLDESLGLQNSTNGVDGGDLDDEDVLRTSLPAALNTLLFTTMSLDPTFPDGGRIAKSPTDFMTVDGDDAITSVSFAGLDDQGTAALADDVVVALAAFDGTNFAAGGATGPVGVDLQTTAGEDIHLFSDVLVDPDGIGGNPPFFAIADGDPTLAGNIVFGVDETGDIAFVIFMEQAAGADETQVNLTLSMLTFQALAHPDSSQPDEPIDLGDFLQLSVGQAGGFDFGGAPPGKSMQLTAAADTGSGGVLVTPLTAVVQINTSNAFPNGAIGYGSQGINAGETVVITYIKDGLVSDFTIPNLDQNEADLPTTIRFNNLDSVNEGSFDVVQKVGSQTGALKITALDTNVEDGTGSGNFFNHVGNGTVGGAGDDTKVDITFVRVETSAGVLRNEASSGNTIDNGLRLTFVNGVVTITGLNAGDKVLYETTAGAAGHHERLLITGVSGNIDVGNFSTVRTDTANAAIGDALPIEDSAPTAAITLTGQTVVHDEDAGEQNDPLPVTLLTGVVAGTDLLTSFAAGLVAGDELLVDEVSVYTFAAGDDVDDLIAALGGAGLTAAVDGSGNLVLEGPNGSTAEITLGGDVATELSVDGVHSNTANDNDAVEDNNDDDQAGPLPAEFLLLDADEAEDLAAKLIGWAESFDAVVSSENSIFDTDGPAASDSVLWSIDVGVDGGGVPLEDVDSGLTTLDDKKILLNKETLSDGVTEIIVGRIDAAGDNDVDGADEIAVALSLTSDGKLRLVQYVPIKHGDLTAADERATFAAGSLFAELKVTDAEGDTDVARADISGVAAIEDGAPTGGGADPFDVEEDHILNTQSTGNNEDSGADGPFRDADGNACTDPAQIDLTVALGIDAGPDESAVFSLDSAGLGDLATTNAGLTSKGDAVQWDIESSGGTFILHGFVDHDTLGSAGVFDSGDDREVIRWTVTAAGLATFKLIDQIDHDFEDPQTQVAPGDLPGENLKQVFFGDVLKVTDAEGDPADLGNNPITYDIIDDVPEMTIDNLIGTGTLNPQIGLWNPSVGSDEDGTLTLMLDRYEIDSLGTGTGTVNVGAPVVSNGDTSFNITIEDNFVGDSALETIEFDLTFKDDGTYIVDLVNGFGSSVTLSSADGALDAGGPDPVRTLTIPLDGGGNENIVFFGVAPTTLKPDVFTAIGGDPDLTEAQVEGGGFAFLSPADMNVSTAGIGLGNNNLNGNEFAGIDATNGKKGRDESFVVNPVTSVVQMKVFIDNSVGGYNTSTEQLYYTVYSEDGSIQGPANQLVGPGDLTSEAGGQKSFLIDWNGTHVIDAVQLTMGTGTIKIPVIEFTQQTANVFPPLFMDLTATLTDYDTDPVEHSFSIDLFADDNPLAEPDFVLKDHEERLAEADDQADVFNIDLANGADQWEIASSHFETGTDTLVLLDPLEGISLDKTSGNDVVKVGSTTIKIQNGADTIDGSDILIEIGGVVVSGDFLTDSNGNVNDSFVFVDPANGPAAISGFDVLTDQIVVSAAGFPDGLVPGVLPTAAFEAGSAADDANDRFIYDTATGNLFFDDDGNGGNAQTLMTTLDTGLAFDETNILVIL